MDYTSPRIRRGHWKVPKGKPSCVRSDGAGAPAPLGRAAAARRQPGTRAAGSWRCSALPPTSAAKRARAPHCAAHSSRLSGSARDDPARSSWSRGSPNRPGKVEGASDRGEGGPSLRPGCFGPWRREQEESSSRWGGRVSCLKKVEKIPQLPTRSCFFFFCCLLVGAGAGSWTRAEPQKSDKDKPWAPSPRSGAQGAGAPLTGRLLRSNEKVKRVQMLVAHHWQFP
ncbi:uncharacterized protein LOC123793047 [Ursus americanus]|uniref:uncharacterized protein LOC123793047 n=1 Tax=Ursus americanus TaxID=9643 RepID=UPI001E679BDF|nr:uncharacterized protein LOC123793047 [Ursus americanus]